MGPAEDIVAGVDALPRRVSVVGSTGTGKTTFARELAGVLGAPFVELDAINWGPGWTMIDPDAFRARVREAIAGDTWVVDGNYGGPGVRDIVWCAADTILWLDYPLRVIYPRLLRRTMARLREGGEIWPGTGNRETLRGAFLSRESLFVWVLRTYWSRRRSYPQLLEEARYAGATKQRFRSPAQAAAWLAAARARADPCIEVR